MRTRAGAGIGRHWCERSIVDLHPSPTNPTHDGMAPLWPTTFGQGIQATLDFGYSVSFVTLTRVEMLGADFLSTNTTEGTCLHAPD